MDAIFAAARYLHAAGASKNLRTAILAYNHSEAYAESVLLRAKLISSYPKSVIATLTGLVDARLPVTGKQVSWGALLPTPPSPRRHLALRARPRNAKAVSGAAKTTGSTRPQATAPPRTAGDERLDCSRFDTAAAGSVPGSVPAPSAHGGAAAGRCCYGDRRRHGSCGARSSWNC